MLGVLLIALATLAQGQTPGLPARTRVEGFFGGAWQCENVQMTDLRDLDCRAISTYQVNWAGVNQGNLEAVFQELAFQDMAKRSHDRAQCLQQFLARYLPPAPASMLDPRARREVRITMPSDVLPAQRYQEGQEAARRAVSEPFNLAAWQKFREVFPRIRGVIEARRNWEQELTTLRLGRDPQDHSESQRRLQQRIGELQGLIAAAGDGIRILAAQVPMGSMETVSEAIAILTANPFMPSQNSFNEAYAAALLRTQQQITPALSFFNRARGSDGLYQLERQDRIALASAGGPAAILGALEGDQDLREKLDCRMRAYYINGPATTRWLEMLVLTGASFGVGAIASAPLRLMASLGITAGSAIQIRTAIQDRCQTPNVVVGEGRTCDADFWANNSLQVASSAMCAAAIIFGSASGAYELARYFPAFLIR